MSPVDRLSRVPMLDVVRAFAILAVFVQHLGDRFRPFVLDRAARSLPPLATVWLESALSHGHWGVDLFFVLSGFTLGLGFVRQHDRRAPTRPVAFFLRRAARILPAFYVALAIHLALHAEVFGSQAIWRSLAVHAALLQGYIAPGRIVLIGASWSLTTEAHFYVLAPLLVRWLLGKRPGWNPTRMVLFVAASFLSVWLVRGLLHDYALQPGAHPGLLELSQRRWVISRVDQFLAGLAGAVVYARAGRRLASRQILPWAIGVAAIALLAIAAPLDSATYLRPGGVVAYPLVTIGMGLLVLAAACLREGRAASVLAPLRWVGVVSYGVFLYHQLALELVGRWLPWARGEASWSSLLVTAMAGGALACLAGWLSWTLLESPVLHAVSAMLRRQGTREAHTRVTPDPVLPPRRQVAAGPGRTASGS